MLNLEISMVTCIKWLLSYYKTATVAIQLDGKHIKSTPNLLFKGYCWRIWLFRCGRNEKCAVEHRNVGMIYVQLVRVSQMQVLVGF
nr:MAG TPA: hypothetical protein [Caudoviricetes sp.]DAH62559.1 MAG TPA: hypothetical protein [Caudoviricetes sp.]